MARKNRWTWKNPVDGLSEVELFSWKYFHDFVCQEMLDYRHYIWRGQRCDDWLLEPTLDRIIRNKSTKSRPKARARHLEDFKYAARGRRGPYPSALASDNDWWALGQHHGLATPLLDWTSSPFVAAYFAFIADGKRQTDRRAIWALYSLSITAKSRELANVHKGKDRPPIIELVTPLTDDNPRLVNQDGLFTRAPDGVDIAQWVRTNFAKNEECIMLKITVPNRDRQPFLRSLNRMNINHLTLFPDLYGASKYCNLDLEIDNY